MTNRCKNITLPQTSFAGGNYWENVKSAGKVREFCQSGKVGTMRTSALAFLNSNRTRMHSSRMHTAHSSSRPGGLHQAPSPRPGTHPPPPVDRHTPVNILPCPKLRLRAVKMSTFQVKELFVMCEQFYFACIIWYAAKLETAIDHSVIQI